MVKTKPAAGHIWRRWNSTLAFETAADRPPRLTAQGGDRVPYGKLDDDGTTILQSDERANEYEIE
jgi:hypothetical protein